MKIEEIIKTAAKLFIAILIASLFSAGLGALFALVISLVSPEFVSNLFSQSAGDGVVRYAAAVGMIWGLFIGAAVSGFACFLAVVMKIIRVQLEGRKGKEGNE